MPGDLPPSSNVTEVRCSAAARMTTLPTAGLPVKKMCPQRSARSSWATVASPSTTVTSSDGNTRATNSRSQAAVFGVSSEGLMTAQHPAAMAETSGESAS